MPPPTTTTTMMMMRTDLLAGELGVAVDHHRHSEGRDEDAEKAEGLEKAEKEGRGKEKERGKAKHGEVGKGNDSADHVNGGPFDCWFCWFSILP